MAAPKAEPERAKPPVLATFKISVKNADMPEAMQKQAIEAAQQAFEKFNKERDISNYIVTEFDKAYGRTWNCVVGKYFGSNVTHQTKRYINFQVNAENIVLWKSK